MAILAPSWRPKRHQNRGQNAKKSMLKTNTFFASIFRGFGPRFGRVFGTHFGTKMYAKSDLKKCVQQAQNTVKTNTESMSARLRHRVFRVKIEHKLRVFWGCDFEGILGGFWEGFGRAKSSIFAHFSMFFRSKF